MKPVHSNTSPVNPPSLAFIQNGIDKKSHDTITILRNKQEKLNRRLAVGLSEDIEESQAAILDDYFRNSFGASKAGFDLGLVNNPYAIVATGSYGRKEICRNPSVSVLFIFNSTIPTGTVGLVRDIVYPLWDLGFTVTHSTKTLKDCMTTSSKDFGTLVSLIDSRFICGISPLYSRLMSQLREKIVFKRKKDILHFIFDRDENRHKKYGNPDLLIEPDLVYGPGGLKDYQAMLTAARIAFGLIHPDDMESKQLLPLNELRPFSEALRFIRRILSQHRKDTRLQVKDQHATAKSLGYGNEKGMKAVDLFLSDLTRHMNTIRTVRRQFFMNLLPEKYTPMPTFEGDIKTGTRWITISRGMLDRKSVV
jgi:[protein-PII] uridylyltransferase